MRHFLEALATFLGVTIAAGTFAIPYAVSKSGIVIGIAEIIILAFLISILYLYLGEVVLRTEGKHQISGYAEKYLGKTGKFIAILTMVFGICGAMSAYLIGAGKAIGTLLNIPSFQAGFLFWVGIGLIIGIGLTAIEKSEIITNGIKLVLFILFIVLILNLRKIDFNNYFTIEIKNMFVPYGIILFAFLAIPIIPEMKEELERNTKELKRAIIYGGIITAIAYVIFTLVLVGIGGKNTSPIAIEGMESFGYSVFLVGNLFFILALAGSFLAIGLSLKELFIYDLKFNPFVAWIFTISIPFLSFILKLSDFISILVFVGAIIGGITGILIILMHQKAKKLGTRKPEYEIKETLILNLALMVIFILGIVYYLLEFIR